VTLTCQGNSYKVISEKKRDEKLDNFERLEKEVERLIDAYAKLKSEMKAIKVNNQDRSQEVIALERRVSKLEEDRRLALEKIDQLLEQLNQIDLG